MKRMSEGGRPVGADPPGRPTCPPGWAARGRCGREEKEMSKAGSALLTRAQANEARKERSKEDRSVFSCSQPFTPHSLLPASRQRYPNLSPMDRRQAGYPDTCGSFTERRYPPSPSSRPAPPPPAPQRHTPRSNSRPRSQSAP